MYRTELLLHGMSRKVTANTALLHQLRKVTALPGRCSSGQLLARCCPFASLLAHYKFTFHRKHWSAHRVRRLRFFYSAPDSPPRFVVLLSSGVGRELGSPQKDDASYLALIAKFPDSSLGLLLVSGLLNARFSAELRVPIFIEPANRRRGMPLPSFTHVILLLQLGIVRVYALNSANVQASWY